MAFSSKHVPSSTRLISSPKSVPSPVSPSKATPVSSKKATPVPSKHRLAARLSSTAVTGSTPVVGTVPQPDGDIYLLNVTNTNGALCVCYTPDLRTLAVGESSGGIRLMKTGIHESVGTIDPNLSDPERPVAPAAVNGSSAVTCLRAWPADTPSIIASYANGKVRVWDVRAMTMAAEVMEERQVLGMALSPCKSHLTTLGDDGQIYVYDMETFKLISKLSHSGYHDIVDGHKNRTFSAVFHPNQPNEFISGGWDNTILYWDTRTAESLRRGGNAHVCGTEAIDITRNGRQVMTCSWRDSDQLQLWDYYSAKLIDTIHPDRSTSYLYAGRYLSDNLLCCGGSDAHLFRLVHIGQKTTVGMVSGLVNGVYSIALGPVGAKVQQNPSLNHGRHILSQNKDRIPRIAFCSNKKVVELEVC